MSICFDPHLGHLRAYTLRKINYNLMLTYILIDWDFSRCLKHNTVERRLSERQSSETSNILTHIFFVLRSNNEKSAITSRNKVLCHFY